MAKRLRLLSLVLVVACGTLVAAAPLPLQNPGFEDAAAVAAGPAGEGWQAEGSPPGWHHWIGSVARTGRPVLRWEDTGGRGDSRCVSLQDCVGAVCVIQTVPFDQPGTYLARAFARSGNPRSDCHLSLRFQDEAGKWVEGEYQDALPTEAKPGEWYELETAARAPLPRGRLVIMLTANRQGAGDKCWFDDVSARRAEEGEVIVSSCTWMHSNLLPVEEPPVTPSEPWGGPRAGEKLRALFLLGSDHSLREQIELARRLDLDYDYTFANDYEESLYALNYREVRQRLQEGAYDVVVVALRASAPLCQALLNRPGEHHGVVFLAAPNVAPALPAGLALAAAPPDHYVRGCLGALPPADDAGAPGVREIDLGGSGADRAVRLTYSRPLRCLTPPYDYEYFLRWGAGYWEGYLQTLARAVLWAAGREPQTSLVLTAGPQGVQARVTIPPGAALQARAWVTDRLNRRFETLPAQTVPAGGTTLALALPAAAASGPARYTVVLRDTAGRSVDFASCLAEAPRPARLLTVRAEEPYTRPGEPFRIRVQGAGALAGKRLQVTLTDLYGREIASAAAPAKEGTTAFTLTPRDHLSTLNWLSARLLAGQGELDAARWYALSPLSREETLGDFQVGTWASTGSQPAYLQDAMLQAMKRAAITEGLEAPGAYLPTLAGGVWPVSTAYGAVPGFVRWPGPGTARQPCLSDPAVRERTARVAEETAKAEAGFAPLFGYLNDETSLVKDDLTLDTCSSPHCQARFRQWLQGRYPTLEALNTDWQTSYRSWEETGFSDFKQARQAGNLAPWVMYRRFMDTVWADGVRWASQGAHRGDPTLPVALANSFGLNVFSGRDYWLLGQANDYTMEYPYDSFGSSLSSYHFDAVRSFAGDRVHHPWIGYVFDEEAIRYDPWWCAFHGAGGVEIYGCMSVFAGHNSWAQVFPTLQLTRRGKLYADLVAPLKQGLGKALMTARRPPAEIAILWSQPSLYVAWAMPERDDRGDTPPGGACYQQYFTSREAFRKAVVSSGRQFDYVCEEQIRAGALSRYKCLLLPATYALGPDTCAALQRFCEAGGTVIADQGVGLANEAGAWYEGGGPAAALFGFRRAKRTLSFAPLTVGIPDAAGKPVEVAVKGATEAVPLVVRTPHGAGGTVYLGFAAQDVPGLEVIFSGLDLAPLATISAEGAATAPRDLEIVRLDRGEVRYLGVLHDYRNRAPNAPATLQLPGKRHLYDVLGGKYLGETDQARLDLPPGQAAVFASLPYQVSGVAVQAAGQARAGQPCRLDLAVRATQAPGDHVLHVEVRKPDGTLAEAYCRNVVAVAGSAVVTIPFAPNDAPGTWQVSAREVATGRTGTCALALQP